MVLECGHWLAMELRGGCVLRRAEKNLCPASLSILDGDLDGTHLLCSQHHVMDGPSDSDQSSSANILLFTAFKEPRIALDADKWHKSCSEEAPRTLRCYREPLGSTHYSDALGLPD